MKNRDVAVMTWASLLIITAGYLMQMLFWMSLFGGFGGRDDRHANAFMFAPALSGNDIARLFSSHPTTEKRIESLQYMQRELEWGRPFRP